MQGFTCRHDVNGIEWELFSLAEQDALIEKTYGARQQQTGAGRADMASTIQINRAPVLTLWAAVVAERLGFDRDEALTFGRAVAGLNAYSKGVSLGLFEPTPEAVRQQRKEQNRGATKVSLLHRIVPAKRTPEGLRALSSGKPISPASVQRYLVAKFGKDLDRVRDRMEKLARSRPPRQLADEAYGLYESFRPTVPAGVQGWGAKGELDLGRIR